MTIGTLLMDGILFRRSILFLPLVCPCFRLGKRNMSPTMADCRRLEVELLQSIFGMPVVLEEALSNI